MATEVTQNYFAWSQEESPVQDSSQGAPQVFDHGSISFGRFDLESLAWEKWSVFANDRRHEEFGKFNGLVAKKKAYFEEYFKRIRELKALQQQNQQTELNLEYSGDGSDSSQTGEDVPTADQGSPSGSGALLDSIVQTEVQTIFEHDLECYDDNDKEMLDKDTSPSVGGMRQIGQQFRESASCDNDSDRLVDVLQQNTNCGRDDLRMPSESTMTPKRTFKKNSQVGQAAKIMPKTVKMTSSDTPGHAVVNKGSDSGKSSVVNRRVKTETIQSLQRQKSATSNVIVGTIGRSKPVVKDVPGVMGIRRPSSPALQRPSTRERRPATRDGSRKPPEVATICCPSTAERRPATRELAAKQTNMAVPYRLSTPNRRSMTKELAPVHSSFGTPCRPSTAERRPITRGIALVPPSIATTHRPSTAERCPTIKQMTQKHVGNTTPSRPSTAERRPVTREPAQKHAHVATLHRPSTADRRPITRETAQKHASVVALHRPSTAERRSFARDIAPKHADVTPARRPSTSERRPAIRDTALKHSNFAGSCWPLTPERHISRGSAPIHADVGTTPHRPSTGERRPIAKEIMPKLDGKTPIKLRGMRANPKDVMATIVTPQKAIAQKLVKSSKTEMKSCAKERTELQVVGKHKASSVNLPPREMTSNVRANRVLENFRKLNKESIQETVRSQTSAPKTATPSQTRTIKTRAPNPPPPPPPLRRPSQISSKANANNLSVGGRKPKAPTPHWH
ncbi:proteoglycan 4-like [Oryza brachyantha]|uniref:TPX2 C-terminal domain-containing protein n=1 Tax=Oryza brachyantha TaxID=4533 RepID=J3M7A3_ORYBR|nr:proteoglycan 4-like [Oryza brachyantha]